MVHAFRQREADLAVVELFDLGPAARRRLDYFHFDDLLTKEPRFSNFLLVARNSVDYHFS